MVQYCDTVLNQKAPRATDSLQKPSSVIKNCQVIRMLTAYAVAIGRTVARGWRVVVRRQAALPGRGIATSFRFMRGRQGYGVRDLLPHFCGVRHRRPGLHGGFLGCASGMARWVTKSNKRYWPARG